MNNRIAWISGLAYAVVILVAGAKKIMTLIFIKIFVFDFDKNYVAATNRR